MNLPLRSPKKNLFGSPSSRGIKPRSSAFKSPNLTTDKLVKKIVDHITNTNLQKTALLGTARILRKVLDPLGSKTAQDQTAKYHHHHYHHHHHHYHHHHHHHHPYHHNNIDNSIFIPYCLLIRYNHSYLLQIKEHNLKVKHSKS